MGFRNVDMVGFSLLYHMPASSMFLRRNLERDWYVCLLYHSCMHMHKITIVNLYVYPIFQLCLYTSFLWEVHWSQKTQATHHTLMNGKLLLHLYSSTGIRERDMTRIQSAVCSIHHCRYQWCQKSWAFSVSVAGYAILMCLIETVRCNNYVIKGAYICVR